MPICPKCGEESISRETRTRPDPENDGERYCFEYCNARGCGYKLEYPTYEDRKRQSEEKFEKEMTQEVRMSKEFSRSNAVILISGREGNSYRFYCENTDSGLKFTGVLSDRAYARFDMEHQVLPVRLVMSLADDFVFMQKGHMGKLKQ